MNFKKNKRNLVAIYPFKNSSNEYIVKMRNFIKTQYTLVDYVDVKKGLFDFNRIRTFYLNWIENTWDNQDLELLKKAHVKKIRIIWVFHNKVPHDSINTEKKIKIMKELISICDHIIIHSFMSKQYLVDYVPTLNTEKVHYIPHVNYFNTYFNYAGDLHKYFCISEKDLVFAVFGLIKPYKNIELVLEVFQQLDLPQAKLLIVGKSYDTTYYTKLINSIYKKDNIIIKNMYINNICMGSYLDVADIIILPYSTKSSVNSGSMIMAFSAGIPTIVPNIAMANDFDERLFYKYDYTDSDSHKKALSMKIVEAYKCGKETNTFKGEELKKLISSTCQDEYISKKLFSII